MTNLDFYYYLADTDEVIKCDFNRWQALAKEHGTCQVVKKNTIKLTCGDDVEVSTICLMCDHNYFTEKPLIFETMLFSDNPKYDGKQRRASTLAEAKKNHSSFIEEIKKSKERKNEGTSHM